jgi:hypothetical protein
MILAKLSYPGWDVEVASGYEAKEKLWPWICSSCRQDIAREQDGLEPDHECQYRSATLDQTSLDEMLWTACGCEFTVTDDNGDTGEY